MATASFCPPLSLPVPPQHYSVIAVSAAYRDHRRGLRAADPAFDAYCRALEKTKAPIQPESTLCVHAHAPIVTRCMTLPCGGDPDWEAIIEDGPFEVAE